MPNKTIDAIAFARAEEALRQEQATFEQRRQIEYHWSLLRLRMGYAAIILIPTIGTFCGYVLINSALFPQTVIVSAGAALFGDVLSLLAAVWKVILNPGSVTKLEPVTKIDI